MAEEKGKKVYYNSAILIDKEGKTVLNYRKTHLWSEYELTRFSHGDCLPPVVEIEGIYLFVVRLILNSLQVCISAS